MARRRAVSPIGLSFLDAITCGFGAVILFYMVINASVGRRAGKATADRRAEVNRLEVEVLEGYQDLVELRNSLRELEGKIVAAHGMSTRLLEEVRRIEQELATYEGSTVARVEHINRLKADLKSLEEDAKRLSAAAPSEEVPGDSLRSFVGDGDRQYLTGLKVGGQRIFVLVDSSSSMLADTMVNILRRRNLPDPEKLRADKWRQTVKTVDWLTTQFPREARFQLYAFADDARAVVEGSDGTWLDAGDREVLDGAVAAMREVVPAGGTNLEGGLAALAAMQPPPDNLILLTDSLPTRGEKAPRRGTVDGKQRMKLFQEALRHLRGGMPVNVILFPMEGDPYASSAFWQLAIRTRGSFLTPTEDWP